MIASLTADIDTSGASRTRALTRLTTLTSARCMDMPEMPWTSRIGEESGEGASGEGARESVMVSPNGKGKPNGF